MTHSWKQKRYRLTTDVRLQTVHNHKQLQCVVNERQTDKTVRQNKTKRYRETHSRLRLPRSMKVSNRTQLIRLAFNNLQSAKCLVITTAARPQARDKNLQPSTNATWCRWIDNGNGTTIQEMHIMYTTSEVTFALVHYELEGLSVK